MCMKVNCKYCNSPTFKKRSHVAMTCFCDDEYRFLNIEEILLGFHTDKVYLLTDSLHSVYDKNSNNIQKRAFDAG